jgi:hypothetical protein
MLMTLQYMVSSLGYKTMKTTFLHCCCRRMNFSLKSAYAHGTSGVRTHLINMTEQQIRLTWPVFDGIRRKWAGKVRNQDTPFTALKCHYSVIKYPYHVSYAEP